MKEIPCESIIWNVLPVIRKELACCMIRNFNLTQKKVAQILGVTPAAISQYRCKKRAKADVKDNDILNEINISTKRIIKEGNPVLTTEICRLCKLIQKSNYCPL